MDNPTTSTLAVKYAARVEQIHKFYPGVHALNNVDFTIKSGEVRALLGKNGAGKSTLIRMLTGVEIPDKGNVFIGDNKLTGSSILRTRKAAYFGLKPVYQELSLIPDMDVAENIFIGNWPQKAGIINHKCMTKVARRVLDELGFPINTKSLVSHLSPAHQQLVEIARAMMGEPKIVILDEPTSSLASEEVGLVFEAVRRMAAKGIAIIYVSHRMKEIRTLASTATIMRDGQVIDTVVVSQTSIEDIVKMMLGQTSERIIPIQRREQQQAILEVKHVKQRPKLKNISFRLHQGEVLGLAGLLGSGRTELLRIIAGIDKPDTGSITFNGKSVETCSYSRRIAMGIALTPEDRKNDGIFPLLGVDENIVMCDWSHIARGGILNKEKINKNTSETVERMNIKTAGNKTPINNLAGGNQQKVVIGRWIYAGSSILLLDEPTRGIDVGAKSQIYDLVRTIAEEGKSIIFVSSEIEELPLVCDRVLVLKDGEIGFEFKAPNIDVEQLMSASIK